MHDFGDDGGPLAAGRADTPTALLGVDYDTEDIPTVLGTKL